MKICIDAGHDYYVGDKGASAYSTHESIVSFKIADKLRRLFENSNYSVVMTRQYSASSLGQTPIASRNKRIEIANNSLCDLFLSIHCGSHCSIRHNGTETQISVSGGEEEKLATKIQQRIVNKLSTNDRGVRVRNAELLKCVKAPAILIETAFITNENDVKLLRTRSDDFAQAIYEGVLEYYNINVSDKKMTVAEAIKIIQSRARLEDDDVKYLHYYNNSDDLLIKLAKAMK